MYLENNCSIEEKAAIPVETTVVQRLYPGLSNSDLTDAQMELNPQKENNLQGSNLYPNLENNFPAQFGTPLDVNKLDNYPQKLNNKLFREINTDVAPKGKIRAVHKDKQCNKIVDRNNQREIKKAKRKHKHLRKGYKVLAFTVGLPITIPYLIIRTKPNKEDDDIEDEFDQLVNSTAKLFKTKGKSKNKKPRL